MVVVEGSSPDATSLPREARRRSAATAVAVAVVAHVFAAGAASAQSEALALSARLDSAARAYADDPTVPGVSVAVVRRGEVLLQRGYGLVDLEWRVPTPPDGRVSYEIGSITKQFTAAAILLLAEEGKVDLDADFTEYVTYDTKGRRVPLRRLLDHTSGIQGYTEMPVFGSLATQPLPQDSLIRLFEAEPFQFEPGTALIYNNSAYFLLGKVIEAVSGQTYVDFVQERLFDPVGMTDSYYCSESGVRPRRAHGYDALGPDSLIRARYLDHRWPYAAGSLCSTVADLVRWNQALHGGRVLSAASYREMTTPDPLEDGTAVRYAMGLGVDAPGGRRQIAHGGGINGFVSDGRYYPDHELIVVVLQNSTGAPPARLGTALVDLVLGPLPESVAVPSPVAARELAGTYRGASRGGEMTIVVGERAGEPTFRLGNDELEGARHTGALTWRQGDTRLSFVRDGNRTTELRFDTGGGHFVLRRVEG